MRLIGVAVVLAVGLTLAPLAPNAQPAGQRFSIGHLRLGTPESDTPFLTVFDEGLHTLGYVEGRNIVVERRFAGDRLERLPVLATELVRLRVDVIVAGDNASIAAAKRATATIPIVMVHATDPVGGGLIASVARPGGNITGLSRDPGPEIFGKRLEMLKKIVPTLSRVAILRQPEAGGDFAALEAAARTLNMTLEFVDIRRPDEVEGAFAAMTRKRVGAFLIYGGPLIFVRRQQIADLAIKNRLPGTHSLSEFARAGLLITYGPSLPDFYRRAPSYVANILKGAKPGDLPIEQPTKFELVINLKTAKALGLTIPPSLLLQADQVIQ